MEKLNYSLYMITDRTKISSLALEESVEQALAGGVTLVQLREKKLDDSSFIALGKRIKRICDTYSTPLIINDRIDVALAVNSYGVHIGQKDSLVHVARSDIGPNRVLGVSVTSVEQAMKAQAAGADYLGIGAMFRTQSKPDASLVSFSTLKAIRKAVTLPIVLIGGLNKKTIPKCAPYDVQGFAVISSLLHQPSVYLAARELIQSVKKTVKIE